MSKLIDLTDQRFGRLTVIGRAQDYIRKTGGIKPQWNCLCECGSTIIVLGESLRTGKTKSCGCHQKEVVAERSKKMNPFRIEGNIIFVKLSNSEKEMVTDVDIWEKGACNYCWYYSPGGYAVAGLRNPRKKIYFHNYAFPECPNGLVCDHIDGNPLNNVRDNIRFVTQGQNCKNHKRNTRNKSGCAGVSWNKKRKRWESKITVDGRKIHIGYFLSKEDAVAARKQAEIKYFGEYRRKD